MCPQLEKQPEEVRENNDDCSASGLRLNASLRRMPPKLRYGRYRQTEHSEEEEHAHRLRDCDIKILLDSVVASEEERKSRH